MNRNHKKIKLTAVILASALTAAMPAAAAGSGYEEQIGGNKKTTFSKYVLQDRDAVIPDMDFTYKISAGPAEAYEAGKEKFEILAGTDPEKVKMEGVGTDAANQIHFDSADKTKNDENAAVKGYDREKDSYIEKEAVLDFSDVRFTEPGIYRYIITESGENRAVVNDPDAARILDVYVFDATGEDGLKKLEIGAYVLHSPGDDSSENPLEEKEGSAGSDAGSEYKAKNQGFTNEYQTVDLTFRKEVSGNQASRNKYFKFDAELTGGIGNDIVKVDLSGADDTVQANDATLDEYEGRTNPAELIFNEEGEAAGTFYLRHGQQVVLQGLPAGVSYSITEAAEDYGSAQAGASGYSDPVSGTTEKEDIRTSYLNTREGTIPTGAAAAAAPFAVLTAAAAAGILTVIRKKH